MSGAPGRSFVRPDLLGYVFHLLWMYLLFYNTASTSTAIGGSPLPTNLVYVTSVVALVATLALGFVRHRTFMRVAQSLPLVVGAPVATALGTVAYCAYGATGALWLVVLGGVTTGAGSAVLAARWAAVFGNAAPQAVINNFALILAIISATAVTVEYLPDVVWVILLVLLPLFSGACLQHARSYQRALGGDGSTGKPEGRTAERLAEKRPARFYLLLMGSVGLLGLCTGSLSAFSPDGTWAGGYCLMFNVVSAVLVAAFVGGLIYMNDRSRFVPAFMAPIAVLVLVFIPFAQFVAGGFAEAAYPIGSIAFELLFLFVVVLFALNADLSPARAFMLARATLAVTDALGALAGGAIVAHLGASAGLQVAGVLLFAAAELLVVVLIVGYVLTIRRAAALGERNAGEKRVRVAVASGAGPLAGAGLAGAPDGMGGAEPEPATSATFAADAEGRCDEVAREFGLSEREVDVLRLLARGRGSAAIQEELCIAPGTFNYHIRNIYAKTGVHTRQELMVLVLGSGR